MYVHDLRDADATSGGKAANLARLIAVGLPVPDGFVIDRRAFHDLALAPASVDELTTDELAHALETAAQRIADAVIPAELVREVADRIHQLGARVVVRSSATIEDGEAGAAAGVFSSRAVPVADVWHAIRAVWTSALTPLAAAYARRRDATIAIGVIVQRQVGGEPIVVYTRPPGAPQRDEVLVQRGGSLERLARAAIPSEQVVQHAMTQALRAEQAIGASAGGADVELVQATTTRGDTQIVETWVVQARPIVHPTPDVLVEPPPIVLAALQDGRVWTWDVAHNPDPLSPAQTGLVELVERANFGTASLRVCAGYLYTSPRDVTWHVDDPTAIDAPTLAARAAALEAKLDELLAEPAHSIRDALDRYLAFYAVWSGELSPLIASARRLVGGEPIHRARPSSVEATLASAARGELALSEVERRLGDLAPTWDVAVAPFGERPGVLREAVANARSAPSPAVAKPADRASALAEQVADLAERDDLLFARAQRLVRGALIDRAASLGISRDDVFWLPLDEVVSSSTDGTAIDPDVARRRAAAARTAADRTVRWQMPRVVGPTRPDPGLGRREDPGSHTRPDLGPESAEPAGPAVARRVLRGVGTGRRVIGRVARFGSLAAAGFVASGDVVVVRAVTPALAVYLGRCAALVSETGGLLDHGAALARELGIVCVVGCPDAWTLLRDGMLVSVDGDAGEITPIVDEDPAGSRAATEDHSS